jgi:hypothetical protein
MRWLLILVLVPAIAHADMPAPEDEWVRMGSITVESDEDSAALMSRLRGHEVRMDPGRLWIVSIANEGSPWVGTVERRGRALWLVTEESVAIELIGPLARPRLAGPGYTIWALGTFDGSTRLRVSRLGVLRPAR